MKKHILIVEDDTHIRLGLVETLKGEGFEVSECADGREAPAMVKQRKPDLILLDVMLPGKSGFDICRELRAGGNKTLIIMLTAKGQEVDKVVGLELGADDYVTKPFGLRELLARVQAVLRRGNGPGPESAAVSVPDEIRLGKVVIDGRAMRGVRGKEKFELTARELKLLALLDAERGRVVDRNRILDLVWGMEYYGTTRTLDQVVVKLRQKVEEDPAHPRFLKTVHGVGYRLEGELDGKG
jgi:DNA-binding response OmpR family regulator